MTKVSLFAQPVDFEPVLKVEPQIFPGYRPEDEGHGVHLNDIGKGAWLTALKLYAQVSLRLERYEGAGHEWTVHLSAPSMELSLRCVEYRKGLKLPIRNPRNFAVVMEFQAGQFAITNFVQKFVAQLERSPSEMAGWEEFTAAFGVSREDVLAQWKYLLDVDIAENLKALYEEVKREIEQAGADGPGVSEQAQALIKQAESAIAENNYDLTISVLETARGMLADARTMARQEERRKDVAADMISFVQTIIIKAAGGGLDTAKAQKVLSDAARALENQDGETAVKHAMQARSLIELESHKCDKARAALQTSRSMIDDAREMGLDISGLIQLQDKGESALSNHSYGVVQHYATTIRKTISKAKQEHRRRLDNKEQAVFALDATGKVMAEALRFDCDMTKCAEWALEARRALDGRDFDRALELAETARTTAEEAMRSCSEAMDGVQLATTTLNDARAFIDVRRIEPYLDRAWAALKGNKYAEAVNASTLCRDMIEVAEVEEEPRIEVDIKTKHLKPGIWNRVLLDIVNSGDAHARNISLKFTGLVEATRLRRIMFLRSGEGYTLEIGLKPAGAGELAYDIETSCSRAFDGVGYTSRTHRWLKVGMEGHLEAPPPPKVEAEWEEEAQEEPEDKADTVVEEVYVVFHDGRLILHEAGSPREDMDEMSLSSLLTAVQEFIKESFKSDGAGLGKLEFGRRKMVLEHGKFIYIAAVLTGRVPTGLRRQMRELLRYIEAERFDGTGVWDGNMSELEDLHDSVRRLFEVRPSEDGNPASMRPEQPAPPKEQKGK